MSRRSKQTLGDSPIGAVLRVIRVSRGLSLEEAARLGEVSAANLSRAERGLPGGLHPRHLERIASLYGISVVGLHALAEVVTESPDLLERPDELAEMNDRLVHLQRAYLRASRARRRKVDDLLGIG